MSKRLRAAAGRLSALEFLLVDGDAHQLRLWTRSTTIRAGLAQRARIVLMAAEGIANARIASEVGTTTTSVWKWRNRYAEAGLAGLADAERSGRPKQVDDERIITAT
jgi:post-segregation antitoxin (ccd killing protein)